jgi:hypothetical protein
VNDIQVTWRQFERGSPREKAHALSYLLDAFAVVPLNAETLPCSVDFISAERNVRLRASLKTPVFFARTPSGAD